MYMVTAPPADNGRLGAWSKEKKVAERREKALKIIEKMLPQIVGTMSEKSASRGFGGEMADFSLNGVFVPLWTDDRLDLRTRSLVTVAMLVAQGSQDELYMHVPAAIRNGATISEVEQVLYQATAYVGLPRASSGRNIAAKALRDAGMLSDDA